MNGLTINQEKQLRALREQEAKKPAQPAPTKLKKTSDPIYEELGRVCAMYRRLKERHDKEAQEVRRSLLAQMDDLLKTLGLA